MPIAAFDFDGTLTTRDTMIEYIRFVRGSRALFFGLIWLSPMLVQFKLGLIPRQKAKERLLAYFFRGESQGKMEAWGMGFFNQILPGLIRPEGLARLAWHQEQGHICFLVTASLSIWTRDWAQAHGLEILASEPEYVDHTFQGKLSGPNCYGPEKVRRLELALEGTDSGRRYAYGDSGGDKEMLAWADEAQFKPFRDQ